MKKADKFYKDKKWRRIRANALIRDEYKCQDCLANGKRVNAECVHHIFPRDTYLEYQYEMWNLISLCDKCHDEMHNHFTGDLSKKGMLYLRALAAERGIKVDMKEETIIVVGLRGCGKSTYCKQHMDDNTLVYDLDAIASAFRLKMPHEEYFKPARRMANDFLKGFLVKAHEYCKKIFIIRTAPYIKELEDMEPTRVVICRTRHVVRPMDDEKEALDRIKMIENYCKGRGIGLEII